MSGGFRDFVEEVRSSTDIVQLIGGDIDLQPSGSTLKGLSPFHSERSPSFVVWPETQSWHDFSNGGGVGGDAFSYLQHRDQVGFKEAVISLAERAGIRRPNQDDESFREEIALLVERRDVERLLSQAAAYYHRTLPSKVREKQLQKHYGFTDETIEALQLGWADGHLFEHFRDVLKVEQSLALKTGLFVVVQGGRVEDFFQQRLVFPYWKGGQAVYFIARSTEYTGDEEWERSKYKKLLTHSDRHRYVSEAVRNDTFYNEDAARGAEQLLITEGVTDCISALQAGIPCISPVTTRFRKQDIPKLVQLTRWAKRVVVCNDAEETGAGAAGALETASALQAEGRDVRVADLPRPEGVDKIDVNEFLKANSAEALQEVLDGAKRYIEKLIEAIPDDTPKVDLDPLLAPVLDAIAARSPIEQDTYLDNLVKRFKVSRRSLNKMVRDRAKEEPQKPFELQTAATKKKAARERPAGESIKGEVYEDQDHYYMLNHDGEPVVLSSFHIEPTERIQMEGGEVIVGDVTTDQGRVYRRVHFPPTAWHSRRSFLQTFPNADMQWTGYDENVQGVLRILSRRQVPIRKGTLTIGYLETDDGPRWVAKDLVLGPDGPLDKSDIVFQPNGSSFPERVRYRFGPDEEVREFAQKVLPTLLELNEPAVVLPVLGWFFATPFKPQLMKLIDHFPILMVWGTQGSGKSTLIKEVFWRLFGIGSTEPYSATETEFALIKLFSSTNAVPVFIDEYKPFDMPRYRLNTLHRYLRRIYGGEVEERGRANLSVMTYRLSAPVAVAGEARPDDPALVDRLVSVMPDKNRLDEHPEHGQAYGQLRALDLGVLAGPYIRFALGRDMRRDFEEASKVADTVLDRIPGGSTASIRCRDNLRVVVFGMTMFEAFAEHMGISDLPELDVEAALTASIADLMDGDKGAKNPLDLFLETCSVLAFNGHLVPDKHFAIVDGLTCLHLRSCWEAYLEQKKRVGQGDDANGLRSLRRLLRENHQRGGYVKDIERRVALGDRRPRLVAIDLEQAAQFLDVDEFPEAKERGWGGARDAEAAWHKDD